MAKSGKPTPTVAPGIQRKYVSQADVPASPLERALRIPRAIADNYGYKSTSPLQVAVALDVQPSSSNFRMLTGAAIAYGLTSGGYNADTISITPLAMRIVRPTSEGDDTAAKREAFLKPRVIREFLQKYDRAPIPRDDIARNVLMEIGVPTDRTAEVLSLIVEGARELGFLQQIKDRTYVDLSSAKAPVEGKAMDTASTNASEKDLGSTVEQAAEPNTPPPAVVTRPPDDAARLRRVFISHGKNRALIEPIKKLLLFGEFVPVAEIENQTVSQPVPTKIMTGMRSCGAAIIHVEDERRLLDDRGEVHVELNENVLIEIGAAMALYGERFILVVKEGVKLPSNLQGLLHLRYRGDTLDVNETVTLMEAMKDMKGRSLPPTG
ncbi:MAG TPA: TIR domain-containing protein [Acidobacteriaceae bacterium]|nr:TIR domain-containing protein [Acidobacteriaceae bacterium]